MEAGGSQERAFLVAAAHELKDYLLSATLNWPVGQRDSLPPLSPGALLLSLKCSESAPADPALTAARRQIDEVMQQWRAAFARKAELDYDQRLNLWVNALPTLLQPGGERQARFAWHARWRAMLTLLEPYAPNAVDKNQARLAGADALLRGASRPGTFVWAAGQERFFPQNLFWYLYLVI